MAGYMPTTPKRVAAAMATPEKAQALHISLFSITADRSTGKRWQGLVPAQAKTGLTLQKALKICLRKGLPELFPGLAPYPVDHAVGTPGTALRPDKAVVEKKLSHHCLHHLQEADLPWEIA